MAEQIEKLKAFRKPLEYLQIIYTLDQSNKMPLDSLVYENTHNALIDQYNNAIKAKRVIRKNLPKHNPYTVLIMQAVFRYEWQNAKTKLQTDDPERLIHQILQTEDVDRVQIILPLFDEIMNHLPDDTDQYLAGTLQIIADQEEPA